MVTNSAIRATMVALSSTRVIRLAIRIEAAKRGAAAICASAPTSTTPRPGLRITTMPAKPTSTAIRRRRRNRSPRNSAAPMVTKIGAVKPSAVTWAIGRRVMAKNQSMTPIPCPPRDGWCAAHRGH